MSKFSFVKSDDFMTKVLVSPGPVFEATFVVYSE